MASVRSITGLASHRIGVALRPAIDFIYPPRCPACGTSIGAQIGLCLACWNVLQVPATLSCPAWGEETGYAMSCGARDRTAIVAATSYCDISRKLILSFKHGGKTALAPLLARLIAVRLGEPQPDRLIVPVPLHPLRLWRRGYNQAALLGRELERLGHGRLLVDGLQRVKMTPSLDQRSRVERATLLASAIRPNPRRTTRLRGADVLLVDDVLTSGATSGACSDALGKVGAASITIACFAKVSAEMTSSKSPFVQSNARDHAIPGVT